MPPVDQAAAFWSSNPQLLQQLLSQMMAGGPSWTQGGGGGLHGGGTYDVIHSGYPSVPPGLLPPGQFPAPPPPLVPRMPNFGGDDDFDETPGQRGPGGAPSSSGSQSFNAGRALSFGDLLRQQMAARRVQRQRGSGISGNVISGQSVSRRMR